MRDTPHDMDRLALLIPLQDEHTRPLIIRRVIFDHSGFTYLRDDLVDQNAICGKFIIAMIRYYYGASMLLLGRRWFRFYRSFSAQDIGMFDV